MTGATEWIGWTAAALLLATTLREVRQQWHADSNEGVWPWMFAGYFLASTGFTVYSALGGQTLFLVVNAMLMVTNAVGQALYWRNAWRARRQVRALPESGTSTRKDPT
jgi:hypothetical protein